MKMSRKDLDLSPTLAYFHVPKTGGKSVYTGVERKFAADVSLKVNIDLNPGLFDQFRSLLGAEKSRLKNEYGHMRFRVHKLLPQETDYFTLLSDPVDRVIS